MSRYECITRIIDQWDALKLCFQMASSSNEKCYTGRQLASVYQDPRNYITLIFLEGTLKDFSRINKLFEFANVDVVRLGSDLLDFFYSLLQRIVIPSRLEKVRRQDLFSYDFQNNLMSASCAYLGYAFVSNAERLKIPKNDLDEVKQRCLLLLNIVRRGDKTSTDETSREFSRHGKCITRRSAESHRSYFVNIVFSKHPQQRR